MVILCLVKHVHSYPRISLHFILEYFAMPFLCDKIDSGFTVLLCELGKVKQAYQVIYGINCVPQNSPVAIYINKASPVVQW